jgi:hypothetical protein
MTLMVPGEGPFSIGSSKPDTMSKSLDDMIKDRRKEQQQASKKGAKKPATSDRTVAAGRAKRAAAVKARRGLSQTKAPNQMEIEREVYRQSRKTAAAKERGEKKATQGRLPANSSTRRVAGRKKGNDAKPSGTPPASFGGRTPSKKAVTAAVQAMEGAGFKVPDGMQVVIALAPAAVASPTPANNPKNTGNNNNKGSATGKQTKGANRRKN